MERHRDRIDWSKREFALHGLGSILVSEAAATVAELCRQSDALYDATFGDPGSSPGDMKNFYAATDLRLIAEELEGYIPELSEDNVQEGVGNLEAFLKEVA